MARPDGDLSVLVSGNESARAVILLHGMRDHAHSMIDLAKHFDPEYRIILPDLRGHGESSSSGGNWVGVRHRVTRKSFKN